MTAEQTVSVIICCYTEERFDDTLEAIASVEGQTRAPDQLILAVDSNRPLFERVQRAVGERVEVVFNDSMRGLSATRNLGVNVSKSELVVFLDDDAVADPNWLSTLTSLFDDDDLYVAGGRAVLDWKTGRPSWFPEELDWVVGGSFTWLPQKRTLVRNPHGHNMCFRREVFDTLGEFDCSVGRVGKGGQAGEEAELCLRLIKELPDARVVYEPSSWIYHKVPADRASWSYMVRRSFGEGKSKARIRQISQSFTSQTLRTESHYLRHLLQSAIPSRLKRFWHPASTGQVAAIVVCVLSTGLGYVMGRWQVRRVAPADAQTILGNS